MADAKPRWSPEARVAGAIEPVQPPFPLPSKLPFQPDMGSQSSILISESPDGFKVAAIRQKAGTVKGAAPLPPRPACGSSPAGTVCASVMAVFSKASEARLSQDVPWAKAAQPKATVSRTGRSIEVRIFKQFTPS